MATVEEYMRAIQRKCVDCCGGSREEAAACEIAACPLHPYRLGERRGDLFGAETPQRKPRGPARRQKLLG